MKFEDSEYTEDALITRLLAKVPTPSGPGAEPGDDAAIIEIGDARFLGCADGLVNGVHFDFAISAPADVGWKSLAVNLSDIAAMGGSPRSALVVMTLAAGESGTEIAEEIYEGMGECAQQFGVVISGGDITSGSETALAVTVLGALPPTGEPLLRSGARPGDLVCVTGRLGEAALALGLRIPSGVDHPWAARHRRPRPRIAEGAALVAAGATAAIDISDGLLLDLSRMCLASGVGAAIEPAQVPTAEIADWPTGEAPVGAAALIERAAMSGGDDYELCFTIGRARIPELEALWPGEVAFTAIGEITPGSGISGPEGPLAAEGWDHFAGPSASSGNE